MLISVNQFNPFMFLEEEESINSTYTVSEISRENCLFAADPCFAMSVGGAITQEAIRALFYIDRFRSIHERLVSNGAYNLVIDTRVNMLMEGMFPSIPGWHCDEVPRGLDGQPDFSLVDPNVRHFLLVVDSGDVGSMTQFLCDGFEFEYDSGGENLYQQLHKAVCEKDGKVILSASPGCFAEFDQSSVHRAVPAKNNGWRYFFRASITMRNPENIIRKQVQSYILSEDKGW